MIWPEPTNRTIPEGHYTFRLRQEPELEEFTYTEKKTGKEKIGKKLTFYVVGVNEDKEEFDARESFFVWDARYADLCAALGVEHSRDIKMSGASFEGDIKLEPDRKDVTKSWPRIINIKVASGEKYVPQAGDKDEDVPF